MIISATVPGTVHVVHREDRSTVPERRSLRVLPLRLGDPLADPAGRPLRLRLGPALRRVHLPRGRGQQRAEVQRQVLQIRPRGHLQVGLGSNGNVVFAKIEFVA